MFLFYIGPTIIKLSGPICGVIMTILLRIVSICSPLSQSNILICWHAISSGKHTWLFIGSAAMIPFLGLMSPKCPGNRLTVAWSGQARPILEPSNYSLSCVVFSHLQFLCLFFSISLPWLMHRTYSLGFPLSLEVEYDGVRGVGGWVAGDLRGSAKFWQNSEIVEQKKKWQFLYRISTLSLSLPPSPALSLPHMHTYTHTHSHTLMYTFHPFLSLHLPMASPESSFYSLLTINQSILWFYFFLKYPLIILKVMIPSKLFASYLGLKTESLKNLIKAKQKGYRKRIDFSLF